MEEEKGGGQTYTYNRSLCCVDAERLLRRLLQELVFEQGRQGGGGVLVIRTVKPVKLGDGGITGEDRQSRN